MVNGGIVLGHHVSPQGIYVYPAKIIVIKNLLVPMNQRDVISFLSHAGDYRRFVENFNR